MSLHILIFLCLLLLKIFLSVIGEQMMVYLIPSQVYFTIALRIWGHPYLWLSLKRFEQLKIIINAIVLLFSLWIALIFYGMWWIDWCFNNRSPCWTKHTLLACCGVEIRILFLLYARIVVRTCHNLPLMKHVFEALIWQIESLLRSCKLAELLGLINQILTYLIVFLILRFIAHSHLLLCIQTHVQMIHCVRHQLRLALHNIMWAICWKFVPLDLW